VVLQLIAEQGQELHFAEIAARAAWTRQMGQRLGFGLFAQTPSPSVTALTVPDGLDGQKIRAQLELHHQITVMGGQDQAKGKIIRIGHMGYIQKEDLEHLESALKEVLIGMKS
jgi:aspartate aminotransferase-like enzyme